jgi:hypothetical protein
MARLIGRTLAVAVHPALAWPFLRPSGRFALAVIYAAAAYVAVLALLTIAVRL